MKYKKNQKYKNTKVEINGIKYDSKKEAKRHQELLLLERAGQIKNLQTQVKFELIPAQYSADTFTKSGKPKCIERECSYTADFVYEENGKTVVEDVKGYRDPASAGYAKFVIKRKMMLYFHGIQVKEV